MNSKKYAKCLTFEAYKSMSSFEHRKEHTKPSAGKKTVDSSIPRRFQSGRMDFDMRERCVTRPYTATLDQFIAPSPYNFGPFDGEKSILGIMGLSRISAVAIYAGELTRQIKRCANAQ